MPAPPPPRRVSAVPDAGTTGPDAHVAVLVAALDRLATVESSLRPAVDGLAEADRLEDLAGLMGRLTDAIDLLKDFLRIAGDAAVAITPTVGEKFPVPGGGTFRVTQAAPKKKIDGPAVQAAVAQSIADTLNLEAVVLPTGETGDPLPVIQGIVETVVKVCGANVPSFTGWRTTTLKELGVNLSRFTDFEPAPLKPVIENRHE